MNRTALLAALLVSALGVALFFLYMRRFEDEATGGAPIEVLMVTEDVAVNEPLTRQALAVKRLPQAYLEDRHIRASDQDRILGIRLGTSVRAGQSLLWTDLETAAQERRDLSQLLRAGMRALTVRAGATSDFGGLLRAGDRVDVLLTAIRPETEDEQVTVPLLQNVLVLAVGRNTGGPGAGAGDEEDRRSKEVSIAVTLTQAAMVTHALLSGEIQLVLRNPEDLEVIEGVPDTTETDLIEAAVRRARARRRPATPSIENITGGRR